MTKLSVNLDKIALVRNSRQFNIPNLQRAVKICFYNGSSGVTIHPRSDSRHATLDDIYDISNMEIVRNKYIELNIEGDIRDELINQAIRCNVTQYTIVPVEFVAEKTTTRGWKKEDGDCSLIVKKLKENGIRVCIFSDPKEEDVINIYEMGADCIEFHTNLYSINYKNLEYRNKELNKLKELSDFSKSIGLNVNFGHDLNSVNLHDLIIKTSPNEVSIGHSIISESIFEGLGIVVSKYVNICSKSSYYSTENV